MKPIVTESFTNLVGPFSLDATFHTLAHPLYFEGFTQIEIGQNHILSKRLYKS